MAVLDHTTGSAPRPSLLNDPVFRGILYQVLVAAAVIAFFGWIILNTAQNLAAQNKTTGFDFLFRTAGFDISFTLFPWSRSSFYWQAFLAGLLNTLLVAVIGIFFATILGFTLGIARLSSNWLIARVATVYIETIRNIPLLLQLFFWYFAVLKAMPAVRQSFELPLDIFINQRGLMVPRPMPDHEFIWVVVAIVVSIILAIGIGIWATRERTATGRYPRYVINASKVADAAVSLLIGLLAFTLLGHIVTAIGANPALVWIGAVVVAALSLTRFAPIGRAILGFVFTWVILSTLLSAMFSTWSTLAIGIGSVIAGAVVAWIVQERAADRPPSEARFPTALLILIVIGIPAFIYWSTGAELAFEVPVLERFNFKGGFQLPPEFVALVFGLSIYTAAFIAENVRGGIRAVSKGQTEAAQSLGLKEGDRLRLVIVPQAMRVIVPPLTSQYLNLTKNSSLGAAIGYPELVNVFTGTTLNQTGKAIEVIAMTMAVYLTFSLLTSAFMNWYNSRVALVER
ncbi:amino acid ABC transporter permease [Devosia epidermidihirudinis]|uniref:amino acid ABC transporter permease n=1 Tax=Devosia epidermidihirudinis TaxID=1293439 RepID=UPI000696A645|nr:ABC transporter permease subunit [Devosia epidermidihirudinis]